MKHLLLALALIVYSALLHAHVTPSGGSRETALRAGERVIITWDTTGISFPVTISLWDGAHATMIPVQRSYSAMRAVYEWTIPDTITGGNLYRFVVASATQPSVRHFSESYVTIQPSSSRMSSVAEEREQLSLRVSPTPARDVLQVGWDRSDAHELVISTLVGTPLAAWRCPYGATRMEIDVLSIPSGVYVLSLKGTHGVVQTQPLLIQR